jgi:hypothetical protein
MPAIDLQVLQFSFISSRQAELYRFNFKENHSTLLFNGEKLFPGLGTGSKKITEDHFSSCFSDTVFYRPARNLFGEQNYYWATTDPWATDCFSFHKSQ